MYLYYDKTRTLKTAIAHGEPIRQNSDINIFVCLDYDFFENIGVTIDKAELSELFASVTYENGQFGTDNENSNNPEFIPFEKVNSSEITYYLKNGEMYWTYQFKFDANQISLFPGKVYLNLNMIVDGRSYAFGVAELFVEARTGIPTVDDSISQTEYDNFTMRLNKLANRITILEQNGPSGGGGQNKLTDLTNTTWKFNDEVTFDSIVNIENWAKSFKINFISNDENWDKIQIMEGDFAIGFDSISYYYDSDSKSVYAFWDIDGDGIPGWERTDGYYQEIEIIDGEDVKNVELINWLYENATLISGGSSSGGGLILDDYYDKTQTDEIFATKQELLEQINKILGEGTIEQLDTIKEVATAIGNNPNFYKEISQLIQNKADSSTVTKIQGIANQNKDDIDLIKGKNDSQDEILSKQNKDIQDLKTLQNVFDNVSVVTATQITTMFNKKIK